MFILGKLKILKFFAIAVVFIIVLFFLIKGIENGVIAGA